MWHCSLVCLGWQCRAAGADAGLHGCGTVPQCTSGGSAGPLGLMQACMDVALPYVVERKQFDKPIGEFQVHSC